MKVDLEKFIKVKKYLKEINETDINDIEWVYKDKVIPVSDEMLQEWKFVGLCNCDFPHLYNIGDGIFDILYNEIKE